jgi:hypothetical protein
MFKHGDKVRMIKAGDGCWRAGEQGVLVELDGQDWRVDFEEQRNWWFADENDFVPEEIYNSPLYKALQEE